MKWPDREDQARFVIAVLGADPFGDVLDRTFAGKTILDREVEIRRLPRLDGADQVHILFVGSSEKRRLARILKSLDGASVLTVSEIDGFAEQGGMIALRLGGDVVRFDVNLQPVEQAHLKMSSQLIRLAQHVIGTDGATN